MSLKQFPIGISEISKIQKLLILLFLLFCFILYFFRGYKAEFLVVGIFFLNIYPSKIIKSLQSTLNTCTDVLAENKRIAHSLTNFKEDLLVGDFAKNGRFAKITFGIILVAILIVLNKISSASEMTQSEHFILSFWIFAAIITVSLSYDALRITRFFIQMQQIARNKNLFKRLSGLYDVKEWPWYRMLWIAEMGIFLAISFTLLVVFLIHKRIEAMIVSSILLTIPFFVVTFSSQKVISASLEVMRKYDNYVKDFYSLETSEGEKKQAHLFEEKN